MAYTGGTNDAWAITLLLKQIRLDRMTVQQRTRMERSMNPTPTAPPYAVGDAVEWRPKPLDQGWMTGRVTSIVDDRPNDGIDKPFWIVRVDTAGERRFCGPVIHACLRLRPTAS